MSQNSHLVMPSKQREYISFNDGIYHVNTDTFTLHAELADDKIVACVFHNQEFASIAAACPTPNFATLGFPMILEDSDKPPSMEFIAAIKTPHLDSILDTQQFDGNTRFWFMAMLGRCLYNLDNWQVAGYLKGLAGTGKSTTVTMVQKFYEPDNIAVLSSTAMQETFELQAITEQTYVITCPEVKEDFHLSRAEFQNMTAGGIMSITRKHKPNLDFVLNAPMLLAGNTLPLDWKDDIGSIKRRIVLFNFSHLPQNFNYELLQQLTTVEMPAIIRKCNLCYMMAAQKVGTRSLWGSGLLSEHMALTMYKSTMLKIENVEKRQKKSIETM